MKLYLLVILCSLILSVPTTGNTATFVVKYQGTACDDFCKIVNSSDLHRCSESPLAEECDKLCRNNSDCLCFSANEIDNWSMECELHGPDPKKYDIFECDKFCKHSRTTEPTPCAEVKDKHDDPLEARCKYICKENAACKCRYSYQIQCPYKTAKEDCYDHCVRDGHLIPDKCGDGTECDKLCQFDFDNVCNCTKNVDDNEFEMPCDSYYTMVDDCFLFCGNNELDRATKCDEMPNENNQKKCHQLCDRDKTNFCDCVKLPEGRYEMPCPYEKLKMSNCSQFCEKQKISGNKACESFEDKEFRRECHFICQTSEDCLCEKTSSDPYEITLSCPTRSNGERTLMCAWSVLQLILMGINIFAICNSNRNLLLDDTLIAY